MSEILKVLNKRVELKSEVVEFGMLQDVASDATKLKKNFDFIINKSSKVLSDYDKVTKMAKTVGVDLDPKFLELGKFLNKISKL
jgi:hypothetical protein